MQIERRQDVISKRCLGWLPNIRKESLKSKKGKLDEPFKFVCTFKFNSDSAVIG
jgi:hypothetical protein